MPEFLRPTARFWYDHPALEGVSVGAALGEAVLAEESKHGVTLGVAWAYAEAMPALLGPDPMAEVLPLAFRRGAMRAAALGEPVEIEGLWHVQTSSPEVCRLMGGRVASFSVQGEECVRALLEHGSAVREVEAHRCGPFAVDGAPFRVSFVGGLHRWFHSPVAEHFLPIVELDSSVWLCWDRDLRRACVVKGRDTVIEGRFGPRDVVPEVEPPPWAAPEDQRLGGEGWAATMVHNHRRAPGAMVADRARGWCQLAVEGEDAHLDALREAWRAGAPLQGITGGRGTQHGEVAALRFEGAVARFAWLGMERVLRVRGGQLEQLTTDHDLRYDALHGARLGMSPAALEQLGEIPDVVTRALPGDAPEEGSCDVAAGDRFVLIGKHPQMELERAAGGREGLVRRLQQGTPRQVARWMREALAEPGREQPVVVIDAGAEVELRPALPRGAAAPEPTMRDLLERPAEFDGRRVKLRGVYRRRIRIRSSMGCWRSRRRR